MYGAAEVATPESALGPLALALAAERRVALRHPLEHEVDDDPAEDAADQAGRDVAAYGAADRECDAEDRADDDHLGAAHGQKDDISTNGGLPRAPVRGETQKVSVSCRG
jgi:hypothetical protein